MRRHLLLPALVLALAACDEVPGVNSRDIAPPQLTDFTISPGDIQFDREADGVKDTVITFRMSVGHRGESLDLAPEYRLTNTDVGMLLESGTLSTYEGSRYHGEFTLATNTNLFHNFELVVFARNSEEEMGNRIVRKLSLRGIPGIRPLMAEALVEPDTVQIPLAGSGLQVAILFSAVVSDEDGADNVDRAYVNIVSVNTGPVGAPITLDRGTSDGDRVSFSVNQFINEANNPDEYRILFFADDKSGLRSDTLERRFVVIR